MENINKKNKYIYVLYAVGDINQDALKSPGNNYHTFLSDRQ